MEQIWWEKVPNAVAFISDIVENLLNEKSIILSYSGELPWYSCMVRTIKESVKQKNSSKRFENVSDIQNPGDYLLKEFCKPEKRALKNCSVWGTGCQLARSTHIQTLHHLTLGVGPNTNISKTNFFHKRGMTVGSRTQIESSIF